MLAIPSGFLSVVVLKIMILTCKDINYTSNNKVLKIITENLTQNIDYFI